MNFTINKTDPTAAPVRNKFAIYDEPWNLKQQVQKQDKQYTERIESLTEEVNRKDQEIAELRLNNEVLIAAMYQSSTPMPVGEPDAVEISHRISTRLAKLRKENEMLILKATGTYAAQLEVELSNLKRVLAQYKSDK